MSHYYHKITSTQKFCSMHTTPVTRHICEYNTLYCVRFRFVGRECALILLNWLSSSHFTTSLLIVEDQEVKSLCVWSVNSLFAIIHVELWIPSNYTDNNDYMDLMNIICDMSQFVIIVPVSDNFSPVFASHFM